MFSVYIRQAEQNIDVEMGSTILETALAAGINYPHGCRAGNCGACKSHLHFGEVELSPYSEFALTPNEYSDGLILPCRAVPWSDCEVSWCELEDVAVHPILKISGQVSIIELLTPNIVSLKVQIPRYEPFEFSSGQYVFLTFFGLPKREYSIANYENNEMEFYIRKVQGGLVSNFVFDQLKVGDSVDVEGPFGNMFYRKKHQGPILAIAGGSGLSAIQPIVLEALDHHSNKKVKLYHGVRLEKDLYRSEQFLPLADIYSHFQYTPVLSHQKQSRKNFRTGMLFEALNEDLSNLQEYKVYLAGPPPMVESCALVLQNFGVDSFNIHADPFFTEADKANENRS